MSSETKHMYVTELTNSQVLEISAIHIQLRDEGLLPYNSNLGMFMKDIFYRGLNEYRKDLEKDYV